MCPFTLLSLLLLYAHCFKWCMGDGEVKQDTSVVEQQRYYDRPLPITSNDDYIVLNLTADATNKIYVNISRESLKLYDNGLTYHVNSSITYNTTKPFLLTVNPDSPYDIELLNSSRYKLEADTNGSTWLILSIRPKRIGGTSLQFHFLTTNDTGNELDTTYTISFPLNVLRYQGVIQIIFRVCVIFTVTVFIFAMGCELDPELLKYYIRRPIGPAIGFACQFIIMPLVAFGIARLVPIRQEFAFGLLTVGCSPGGGASNMWALMLGGDINLSILMTFISSLCALFMMPLLLFIYARFFIDFNRIKIPYGSILIQLLQITIPAAAGLGLRIYRPKWATRFRRLTRPIFLFFIVFFLTFGIYANLSILSLTFSYPIVLAAGALLPWSGFCLAGLAAFLLRQPKPVVITILLETGIQNVGVAILVLLYSMEQPFGDLGAVMPISVSLLTPLPLGLILLGMTIYRKCSSRRRGRPASIETASVKSEPMLVDEDDNLGGLANGSVASPTELVENSSPTPVAPVTIAVDTSV